MASLTALDPLGLAAFKVFFFFVKVKIVKTAFKTSILVLDLLHFFFFKQCDHYKLNFLQVTHQCFEKKKKKLLHIIISSVAQNSPDIFDICSICGLLVLLLQMQIQYIGLS